MKKDTKDSIEMLSINTIRFLSVDAVEKANSGHPGTPMALAPAGYALYHKIMKHNPANPNWANRDRFILSAGHASMLLYSLLHLSGYEVSLEDLKNFRQWASHTPGHPEYGHTPGVETTTGPLGQGIATAVGLAMGQKYLNSILSPKGKPLFDYHIYGIASDGDIMEGVGSEAASLAGHLGLNKMIFFYDNNRITIDGKTDLAMSENTAARFKAYGWNVVKIADGNNLKAIVETLQKAQKEKSKPTLIDMATHIGYGSPNKVDTAEAHGSPLGADEAKLSKSTLKWLAEHDFFVPNEVREHFAPLLEKGRKVEDAWNKQFNEWAAKNPNGAALYRRLERGELPKGWEHRLPDFSKDDKLATRAASGKFLNAVAADMPELIGGSADLAPSNNTMIKGAPEFSPKTAGRNLHFGVREHAMAAALNGLALTKMLRPYGGTFLIFSDYMKGGMRISALAKLPVVYVLTHDSIGLGEDGPTHQPIEQLAHLRATPNFTVIRPADANETSAAWAWALKHKTGPVVLALTRQNVPTLHKDKFPNAGQVEKGGYILRDANNDTPQLILIATGSEVSLALAAQEKLEAAGTPTRVVSLPSWEIFEAQPEAYREEVLPKRVRARVSIEALSTFGWERWVGSEGRTIGMTTFGASAPGNTAMEKFGFTAANIVRVAKEILSEIVEVK